MPHQRKIAIVPVLHLLLLVGPWAVAQGSAQGIVIPGESQRSLIAIPLDLDDKAQELKLTSQPRIVIKAEWAQVSNVFPGGRSVQHEYLQAAAENGHARAAFLLARQSLSAGESTTGFRWMLRAAQTGDLDAQYQLAILLANGTGTATDRTLALAWLVLAARGGHGDARKLAREQRVDWQRFGPGIEQLQRMPRDEPSFNAWYEFALTGSAVAATQVGARLYEGGGIQANKGEGVRWLQQAAFQGGPLAMFFLGRLYANGQTVGRDWAAALVWLRLALRRSDRSTIGRDIEAEIARVEGAAPRDVATAVAYIVPEPTER